MRRGINNNQNNQYDSRIEEQERVINQLDQDLEAFQRQMAIISNNVNALPGQVMPPVLPESLNLPQVSLLTLPQNVETTSSVTIVQDNAEKIQEEIVQNTAVNVPSNVNPSLDINNNNNTILDKTIYLNLDPDDDGQFKQIDFRNMGTNSEWHKEVTEEQREAIQHSATIFESLFVVTAHIGITLRRYIALPNHDSAEMSRIVNELGVYWKKQYDYYKEMSKIKKFSFWSTLIGGVLMVFYVSFTTGQIPQTVATAVAMGLARRFGANNSSNSNTSSGGTSGVSNHTITINNGSQADNANNQSSFLADSLTNANLPSTISAITLGILLSNWKTIFKFIFKR